MIANILLNAVPLIPLYLAVYMLFLMRSDFDLTLAGSFSVGGAVTAMLLTHHWSVGIAVVASVIVAGLLGVVTATLHSRLRIPVFLAGLIMSIGLQTVTLRVMDKQPTVSLIGAHTVFSGADGLSGDAYSYAVIAISAGIVLFALLLVGAFLHTEVGLALRAAGSNALMARSNGFNDKAGVTIALAIGNALAGLSGSLIVQVQNFAVSSDSIYQIMGSLGGVVIGTFLVRPSSSKIARILCTVTLGSLIYQAIVVFALDQGIDPVDLKLVTAATLAVAIAAQVQIRRVSAALRRRQFVDSPVLGEATSQALVHGLTGD